MPGFGWRSIGALKAKTGNNVPQVAAKAGKSDIIAAGSTGATLILDLNARIAKSYPGSGTAWKDLTANKNDAVLYNGVTYGAGYGGALSFSGVGSAPAPGTVGTVQYAQVKNGVYFNGDLTILSWVYVTGVNNWQRIIDFGNGAGDNSVLLSTTFGGTGAPGFYCQGAQFQASRTLQLNAWNHVCATVQGTTATIYMNGTLAGTATVVPAVNISRQYCYIGRSEWAGDGMYQGGIGAIQVYSGYLTAAEILANYNSSKSKYTPLGT